jgi:hypothetical protein
MGVTGKQASRPSGQPACQQGLSMALSLAVEAPRAASRGQPAPPRSTVAVGMTRANRPKVESANRVLELDE